MLVLVIEDEVDLATTLEYNLRVVARSTSSSMTSTSMVEP